MKNLSLIVGILMIVGGIALGCYMGIWWAFIGGIIDVISAIRAETLIAVDVAIGVAKVIFAGVIGWGSAVVLILPGYMLTTKS